MCPDRPNNTGHPDGLHPQTRAEEAANIATHGVGFVLAVAALTLLVVRSTIDGDVWRIVTLSVFGVTLTAMYLVSTLYHAARTPGARRVLRVVDHAVIFVFIAGSYTPIMLVTVGGAWGWSIFGVVWAIACAGVLYKLFATGRHPVISSPRPGTTWAAHSPSTLRRSSASPRVSWGWPPGGWTRA